MKRLWGDQFHLWGDSSRFWGEEETSGLLWSIEIDWDGDGILNGDNESSRVSSLYIRRGRDYYLNLTENRKADGFQRVQPGRLTITLDNHDGRYDPYNASSPLYPNVAPGKLIRVRVRNGVPGTTYSLFTGTIDDIVPDAGSKQVRVEAVELLQLLSDRNVRIGVQQNINISEAIAMILQKIEWTYGSDIDNSADVVNYWWADGNAYDCIYELAEAELGQFFVAADGKVKFYSRHRLVPAVITFGQNQVRRDVTIRQPWESLRNHIIIRANPRTRQPTSEIWKLMETPFIEAGETKTFWGNYTHNGESVPALGVISPVAGTDYTLNTAQDGSGTNITSNAVVTFYDFGTSAKIVVKNNSTYDGYITLLRVRGDAIVVEHQEFVESQSGRGDKILDMNLAWLQNNNRATDFANWLLSILGNTGKYPLITLEGQNDIQFAVDLFDKVNFTSAVLGISGVDYKVGMIEHRWPSETGQTVLTTWQLEPYADVSGYWQFPTQIGVNSKFGL